MAKHLTKAAAYLRTSSAANTGPDKDSDKRQRAAIDAYAKAAGYEIVEEFYDAAVSGADPVSARPGFSEMLEALLANGARTIIVESPDRFARDLMVQLAGHDMLKQRGIVLIAASAPQHFTEDTPTAVLVRQVLGAIAEFDKTTLVAKLAAARRRKRIATGRKVEGRKSHAEARPEVVALVRALRRRKPKGGQMSLRAISAELAAQGHLNEGGRPFNQGSIAAILDNAKKKELDHARVAAANAARRVWSHRDRRRAASCSPPSLAAPRQPRTPLSRQSDPLMGSSSGRSVQNAPRCFLLKGQSNRRRRGRRRGSERTTPSTSWSSRRKIASEVEGCLTNWKSAMANATARLASTPAPSPITAN